ncbi:hypothetical protein MKP05_09545 [Halomonas sp. EGI 63088]|uniref:Uncharacterized protein n=1 Tax=Halomonas flagellata TaxID=2920385 RepID=A0ABS9RU39_9GAMM|nr:hypothetical protein [Halomonas flagellata]MCH4563373.1 hypothetical protein [Halomonas flagellata]
MIVALTNPFHTLAAWLVGLLPAGSGSLATGSAALLGIFLVLMAIVLPICLAGAAIERYFGRL